MDIWHVSVDKVIFIWRVSADKMKYILHINASKPMNILFQISCLSVNSCETFFLQSVPENIIMYLGQIGNCPM